MRRLLASLAVGGALIAPSIAHSQSIACSAGPEDTGFWAHTQAQCDAYLRDRQERARSKYIVGICNYANGYSEMIPVAQCINKGGKVDQQSVTDILAPKPDAIWVPLPLNTAPTSNQSGKSR